MNKPCLFRIIRVGCLGLLTGWVGLQAEDADRFRPYLRFHSGDVDPLWEYGQGWVLASLRLRHPMGRWTPYALLGAGVCYSEFKDEKLGSVGVTAEGNRFHPAVGVGAGVEYFIVRNFSLNADVRWDYSWDHQFAIPGHLAPQTGDMSYFAATLGFRVYLFDF